MTSRVWTRRDVLKAGAAGAAAVGLAGLAQAARAAAAKRIPVALQLYSVRQDCAKDFDGTVAKVAQMGYEGVEFAGFHGKTPEDVRKMLDANGLKCAGTHTAFGALQGDNLPKTIDLHKTIGAKFIIVPGGLPGKSDQGPKQAWLDAAKRFNEVAARLKEHGLYTGYHNHGAEFKPIDGEMPWDIFFSNTVPEVCQQLDTGNCMGGGGKPLDFLKKYPGRTRTVHLKEHGGPGDFGKGECPWKEIFELCETSAGTEWYIIEQERYNQPPIDCVKQCIDWMRQMGKAKA